jgi:hypothetical protein
MNFYSNYVKEVNHWLEIHILMPALDTTSQARTSYWHRTMRDLVQPHTYSEVLDYSIYLKAG